MWSHLFSDKRDKFTDGLHLILGLRLPVFAQPSARTVTRQQSTIIHIMSCTTPPKRFHWLTTTSRHVCWQVGVAQHLLDAIPWASFRVCCIVISTYKFIYFNCFILCVTSEFFLKVNQFWGSFFLLEIWCFPCHSCFHFIICRCKRIFIKSGDWSWLHHTLCSKIFTRLNVFFCIFLIIIY